jgi:lysine-specific demethylase 8
MNFQARNVPRIHYPELDRFNEEHYAANEPAIIVGVPAHHDLETFRLSPDYLETRIGDLEYPVLSTDTGFLSYERDSIRMTFREFADRLRKQTPAGPFHYFKNSTKLLPTELDDSHGIRGLARFFTKSVIRNLWISRGSITVGLHFDAAENLNIQVRGRKRFMLYPPGTTGYYPCPMFSQTAHISQVFREQAELDAERFPSFDPSRGREAILEEGEILYLPPYWWHQVTSLGDINVNVNTWCFPSLRKQLANPNQALRGHYQVLSRLLKFGDITKAPARTRSG